MSKREEAGSKPLPVGKLPERVLKRSIVNSLSVKRSEVVVGSAVGEDCAAIEVADDEEIISLRSSIRKAAESKLSHGIIDVNDLVREINQENAAKVQRSMHEIEMLKQIYDYKFTTNH